MQPSERLKRDFPSAQDGLPASLAGKIQIEEWESKAVRHKKLQTLQLIHETDIPSLFPSWEDSYEVVDVVITIKKDN